MSYHTGNQFTTKDQDNDRRSGSNCAYLYMGGWWYNNCYWANLNGMYLNGSTDEWAKGVVWFTWLEHSHSLLKTEMKLRPIQTAGTNF